MITYELKNMFQYLDKMYFDVINLAGVGRVRNVRFDQLFTVIMWDPPLTAGTLDSLHYRVIVVNNDTGVVIVNNTTTVTTQPLPDLQRCQYYTANVTAFSSEHHGDSVVTGERSPGGTCMCVHVCKCLCTK